MNKIPKAQYSPEFREQAVKSFKEGNLTIVEAAKRLSMPKATLLSWAKHAKVGNQIPASVLH